MTADAIHTGSCRCGAVVMRAREKPFWRSYCHCADCRKQTGAPVSAFVGFREAELDWEGTVQIARHGPVERGFCGVCGGQIGYRDDRLPGEIYFYLGFMDRPLDYPPELHAFYSGRLPFLHMDDDLPRHDGVSVERAL